MLYSLIKGLGSLGMGGHLEAKRGDAQAQDSGLGGRLGSGSFDWGSERFKGLGFRGGV